jgi:predicted component of viral defense system (DUF524 family)
VLRIPTYASSLMNYKSDLKVLDGIHCSKSTHLKKSTTQMSRIYSQHMENAHSKAYKEKLQHISTLFHERDKNNYQLFLYLTHLFTDAIKRILANEEQVYKSSGQLCGVSYLKLLIQKVEADTRATTLYICRLLT